MVKMCRDGLLTTRQRNVKRTGNGSSHFLFTSPTRAQEVRSFCSPPSQKTYSFLQISRQSKRISSPTLIKGEGETDEELFAALTCLLPLFDVSNSFLRRSYLIFVFVLISAFVIERKKKHEKQHPLLRKLRIQDEINVFHHVSIIGR